VPDTSKRKHRFLNGPQPDMVLVDEVFNSTGTPTDILWLLHDHQNTVTDVATMSSTSGQATHRNHLEYNAFGAITSQTNATYAPLQTYTGQILDTTTGLLFYDARWYDPKLGRFVSEDPIEFAPGDGNLFRYVGNSWPNGTDPTGKYGVQVHFFADTRSLECRAGPGGTWPIHAFGSTADRLGESIRRAVCFSRCGRGPAGCRSGRGRSGAAQ
jgi:RHS repeat-associated protein